MRVLVVHNRYQQRGGEDVVVENELALLRRGGFEATAYMVNNDALKGRWSAMAAGVGTVFSLTAFFRMIQEIRAARPDVVHVHNFFPRLSPSVIYACRAMSVPIVLTLHNFRIVCPTAILMYEGKVEERSFREGPWWAVREKVYRASALATFALAAMIAVHRRLGTWKKKVDVFIVLSRFAAVKFETWGLPMNKIVVKPNFVESVAPPAHAERSGFLFVGRLSEEKGVAILLEAARELPEHTFRIAGDGPLAPMVRQAGGSVKYLGALDRAGVRVEMEKAAALVLPSTCFEGLPMVLVEAFAAGLPVVASRRGALEELVQDGFTGLLFQPGDPSDLAKKLGWISGNPSQALRLGENARLRFEAEYSPEANLESLKRIYARAIGGGAVSADSS